MKKNSEILSGLGESASERMRRELEGFPRETLRQELFGTRSHREKINSAFEARKLMADFGIIQTASEAHRSLVEVAKPYGGIVEMVRKNAQIHASLTGTLFDQEQLQMLRQGKWTDGILATQLLDFDKLYPDALQTAKQAKAMHQQLLGGIPKSELASITATSSFPKGTNKQIEATQLKMSVLAGLGDTLGFASESYSDALSGLLGSWRTHDQLPENFWRDPVIRKEQYREAEVDRGLVEVGPPALVEVVIESGLLAGAVDESGAVGFMNFSGLTVSIRSAEPRIDAFRAIDAFEQDLRDYIQHKMQAKFGIYWFKHNVNGELREKAKRTREAALKNGETERALLNFVDLGDLVAIIQNRTNWNDVFCDVFRDKQHFTLDMGKLVAIRRPTMHARHIDGVQLLELLIVMQKVGKQIADDGQWKIVAQSDD